MRYFVKILGFDTPGNLYRFDTGNQAIVEEYWTPNGWKRDDDAELVGYLVAGEGDFDEIPVEKAQEMFPAAFGLLEEPQSEVKTGDKGSSKRIYAKVPENFWESEEVQSEFIDTFIDFLFDDAGAEVKNSGYRVVFEGGSIFCVIDGVEVWERTQRFLTKKSTEGKLKCFRWWCEMCETAPLVSGGDPASHVIKISFPNILKLIAGFEVSWQWKDPNGKWASSQGTAAEAFAELVAKKSRPSCVVSISQTKRFDISTRKGPDND